MTCEVRDCSEPTFAACHCQRCNGSGPLLCFEHFENNACVQVQRIEDAATTARGSQQLEGSRNIEEMQKQQMRISFLESVKFFN